MAVLDRYDNINGYTVLDLIKSNVHTETYRVEDTDGKHYFLKLFAIKELPTAMINAKTGTVYEIEYSKSINHRNIIRAIADGRFDNDQGSYQYYITSYFNGQILADKIATTGKLGEEEALKIFRGLLSGLGHLHGLSPALCHNDLDTSNIIIQENQEGEPVIIDLGHISKRSFGTVHFNTSDLDPLYHANETMVNIFDEKGDIFSACAVLFAMLTGNAPWDMEIQAEGTYKEKFKELAAFRKKNRIDFSQVTSSPKVQFILEKGLAVKSEDRIEKISEIIAILNAPDEETPQENTPEKKDKFRQGGKRDSESAQDPNAVNFEIKRGGGNGFMDIAGMHKLKEYLYKQVIFVLKDKELAEQYRLTPPNGMLLYGPPGCGKTFFAEKFAEETGFNFILIKASDLGSSFVHGSQEKISKLFKIAEQNAPIVLCFDEFDALVPDRSTFGIQSQAGEVNEFLSQMNNCSKKGIFIVATSNRPDKIDPAVLRTGRIDKNVYVPLPDREARREMFSLYLAKRPVEEGINLDLLADRTEGYIASDIAFIVNDAAMTAAYTRVKISQQLLESSLSNIRPSLRSEVMASYTQIKDRMEDKNRSNNARAIVNGL